MIEKGINLPLIRWFGLVFTIITLINVTVLLDIPVIRQISGFILLTFTPGFLLLLIFKHNKLGTFEKIVLSVGASVSFNLFFGLVLNGFLLAIGHSRPLSTISLLISYSIAITILAIVVYLSNRVITFSYSSFKLTTKEKGLLVLPALFPLLSIIGLRVMNITNNNVLLMILLLLIPAYVIFISFCNNQISQKLYPSLIYPIGISLVLMLSLRSNHIQGSDVHNFFRLFQQTLQEGHWGLFTKGVQDSNLSISILPTIYQSLMNIDDEYLYKILYPLLFSFSPIVVYVISQKYIGNFYAFVCSFLFMSQVTFLWSTAASTTVTAIFFFALTIMVIFHDGIGEARKRILLFFFGSSVIVSHYTTSYIFFFLFLFTWLGMVTMFLILSQIKKGTSPSKKSTIKGGLSNSSPENITSKSETGDSQFTTGRISATIVTLVLVLTFFWYSQITIASFKLPVSFINHTLENLSAWASIETKGSTIAAATGKGINTLPQIIRVIISWFTVAFIAIGVFTTIIRYKTMVVFPTVKHIKAKFLNKKFEVEYVAMALASSGILFLAVVLPYIGTYSMERTFFQLIVVLSPFFVIGGVSLAGLLKLDPRWILIPLVITLFLTTTGITNQILNSPSSQILNSSGQEYRAWYVHESESRSVKWLSVHQIGKKVYYFSIATREFFASQSNIKPENIIQTPITEYHETTQKGTYIYLRYDDIAVAKLTVKYPEVFIGKNKIYTSGNSEIYRKRY